MPAPVPVAPVPEERRPPPPLLRSVLAEAEEELDFDNVAFPTCVALVRRGAAPTEAAALCMDLNEEIALPIGPQAEIVCPCAKPVVEASGRHGAYGFCYEHYASMPLAPEATFDFFHGALQLLKRWAAACGIEIWLSGATGRSAILYEGVDPTERICRVEVLSPSQERLTAAHSFLLDMTAQHGYRAQLSNSLDASFDFMLFPDADGVVGVVEVVLRAGRPICIENGRVGEMAWNIDTDCRAMLQSMSELVFGSPPPFQAGPPTVSKLALSVTAAEYARMPKIRFPPPPGYGDALLFTLPAPRVLKSVSGVFDPFLLSFLGRVGSSAQSLRDAGLSLSAFASPGLGDNAGFLEHIAPLLAITAPGTSAWHYLYSETPRIVFVLSNAAKEPMAYAFVKIFRVKAEEGAPRLQPKKPRPTFTAAMASPSVELATLLPKHVSEQLQGDGCVTGFAFYLAHTLYQATQNDPAASSSKVVAYIDQLASAPEARGMGQELMASLLDHVFPIFGSITVALEPLGTGLIPYYRKLGFEVLSAAASRYYVKTLEASPAAPLLRIPLLKFVPFASGDKFRNLLFAALMTAQQVYDKAIKALLHSTLRADGVLEHLVDPVASLVAAHCSLFTMLSAHSDPGSRGIQSFSLALTPSEARIRAMLLRQMQLARAAFPAFVPLTNEAAHSFASSPLFPRLLDTYKAKFATAIEESRVAVRRAMSDWVKKVAPRSFPVSA